MTRTVARSSVSPAAAAPHSLDIATRLGSLLEQIEEDYGTEPDLPTPEAAPEVILDMQLDGMRYTLVRVAARHASIWLSPREAEIARLVARGLPNKAIAAILDISLWTVATYLRRLFLKLDVNSRAEMVARVLNEGLIEVADH